MNEKIQPEFLENKADMELAEQMNRVVHPVLPAEKAKAQIMQIKAAAQAQKHAKVQQQWKLAFAAIGTLAVVGVLLVGLVAGLFLNTTSVKAARLSNVAGIVEISKDAGQTWSFAENGDTLKTGDSLRTYIDSSTVLTYPDGSVVAVGADASLSITTLEYSQKTLRVTILQTAGETTHWVVPVKEDGFYLVNTQNGTAKVHGTVFNVNVPDAGLSRFSVQEGKVAVSNTEGEVFLTPGQVTLAESNGTLVDPAYDFSLKGILEQQNADGTWVVNGVTFSVTDETRISGEPVVGDTVHVAGRILEDGKRIADVIMLSKMDKEILSFSGVVDSTGVDAWSISGQSVMINPDTEIGSDLADGSLVEVRFTVQEDGSWLALEISALEDAKGPPEGKPKGPKGTPDVDETDAPEDEEGTPEPEEPRENGICDNGQTQPEAVRLAERHGVSYEVIMGWFCLNNGFGEIDLAYSLSLETGVSVEEIFAMRDEGMGWGQIKQELQPKLKPTHKPTKTPKVNPGKGPKE